VGRRGHRRRRAPRRDARRGRADFGFFFFSFSSSSSSLLWGHHGTLLATATHNKGLVQGDAALDGDSSQQQLIGDPPEGGTPRRGNEVVTKAKVSNVDGALALCLVSSFTTAKIVPQIHV